MQAHPLEFLGARPRTCLQALRQRVEGDVVRYLADAESAHQDAPDAVRPFGVLVLPRAVIARARGQHVHVVARADLLRDEAARVLGTGADVGAVSRGDERELHRLSNR